MKSVFDLLDLLTQSHSTHFGRLSLPSKNSKHPQIQTAAISVAHPEPGMPSSSYGLACWWCQSFGVAGRLGEKYSCCLPGNYKRFHLDFDWGWGRTKCI